MTNMVEKAFLFDLKVHGGQTRKDGKPYITHPFSVAMELAKNGANDELICAGLLHDTIEDGGVTPDELKREFGEEVLRLVLFDTENKKLSWKERKDATLLALEKLCRELSEIVPEEKIRVDLGLVNKKNYYTGIIFKGYVEGYGQPVLSGGRYDSLIGEFGGTDAKAVGFAVNIEAAAKVYLKNKGKALTKTADVLVFSKNKITALKACEKLISEGVTVLIFNGECPKCAEKFAKSHGIHRLEIIGENGEIESREV